jgi:hypothetical protein
MKSVIRILHQMLGKINSVWSTVTSTLYDAQTEPQEISPKWLNVQNIGT